jgi:hypothetical protein
MSWLGKLLAVDRARESALLLMLKVFVYPFPSLQFSSHSSIYPSSSQSALLQRNLANDIVAKSILQVADNFVDQVLQAACKNAKERGSKVLEIRDIQLTLERGYNIRIPGYASDEIRTVRKIQPSPAWIAKMSAVQAAKVTGGKNSD